MAKPKVHGQTILNANAQTDTQLVLQTNVKLQMQHKKMQTTKRLVQKQTVYGTRKQMNANAKQALQSAAKVNAYQLMTKKKQTLVQKQVENGPRKIHVIVKTDGI